MVNKASYILRTIILDDSPSSRGFLRDLLTHFEFIELIGEADSAEKAMEMVEKAPPPHQLITDIRLPGMGGVEFAGVLKERFPPTKAVLITLYDGAAYRREAERPGFPYIPKSSLLEELPPLLAGVRDGVLELNQAGADH